MQCMSSGGAETLILTLLKLASQGHPRTTDTLRLNPLLFEVHIQTQVPNEYLGCGCKCSVFIEILVE